MIEHLKILAEHLAGKTAPLTPNERPLKTWEDLSLNLGDQVRIVGPTGPSNASDIIAIGEKSELWLSVVGNLATILWSKEMDPSVAVQVVRILESNGWTIVPESVVQAPVQERLPGYTWFTLFFDYD